jgi:uncharacterized protein YrrD
MEGVINAMDAKTLKGLAIVSVEEGEKIGTVDGIVFDLERRRVAAYRVGGGGLFRSSRNLVEIDDVKSLGPDALMIANRRLVRDDPEGRRYGQLPDLPALTNVRVVTENGTFVGSIESIIIDEATGRITEFEVSGGGMLSAFRKNRFVPNSDVRHIGRDIAVVPDHYAAEADSETEHEPERTAERREGTSFVDEVTRPLSRDDEADRRTT